MKALIGNAGVCHLGVLAAIGGYLALLYPDSRPELVLLMAAAVASESMPARAKRWLAGEALLIAVGIASWYWLVQAQPAVLAGWMRMLIAYWLLVPSRPGLLRWVVSLCAAEALWLGSGQFSFKDWQLARGFALAWPLALLLPITFASLSLDAWLAGRVGGRGRTAAAWPAATRWAIVPALIMATVILVAALVIPHRLHESPRLGNGQARSGISAPSVAPGEARWIVRDPTPKIRLLWDDPAHPQFEGSAYLRLFTLPHLRVDATLLRWEAEPQDRLRVAASRFDPKARLAWIMRMPIGNDAAIACEPGLGVELDDLVGDRHGNRYQPRLDESPRAYRINLDAPEHDDSSDDPLYTEVPDSVSTLPWELIEDPAWRTMSAAAAGEAITRTLRGLCTYDIENLPAPAPRSAGMLYTFLWGETVDRRGHCQHFSTAAAIMLRRLGHPARLCAGYVSDERDSEGYTFRGLHAHAWLEFRAEDGRWQRLDPTPPGHADYRLAHGVDPETAADAPPPAALPNASEVERLRAQARSNGAGSYTAWGWLLALQPAAVVALVIWRRRIRELPLHLDPHQADLRQRADRLERLAAELGVTVAAHHTLSELAAQLSARTGVDLSAHLQAHLAARYGQAPLPEPWPYATLRQAARQRSARLQPA